MSKFLKICLIIGIVCVIAGVIAFRAGVSFDGLNELKERVLSREWSFGKNIDLEIDPFFELDEQLFFDENEIINQGVEAKTDNFAVADVREINLKCAGVKVNFVSYDGGNSSVTNSGDILVQVEKTAKYQSYLKEGVLYIKASNESKVAGNSKIDIMIPASFLQSGGYDIKVEASASEISLASLNAADVEIDMSAGVVNWVSLSAQGLEIKMAAGVINGKQTIVAGETDISMSAGAVEIEGILGTETGLDLAAGSVILKLEDAYEDYNYDISCAGGKVAVGTEIVEGIAKELEIPNQAAKEIDVECSMGSVEISFN